MKTQNSAGHRVWFYMCCYYFVSGFIIKPKKLLKKFGNDS